MNAEYQPLTWRGDRLTLLDQTRLPHEEVYLDIDDYRVVAGAIKEMRVRGAPVIGVAAAYAVVLGAKQLKVSVQSEFLRQLDKVIAELAATRPTARNLFHALERMRAAARATPDAGQARAALEREAVGLHEREIAATRALSERGAALIKDGFTVLTHCNTGPLAATGLGTALGVIIFARNQGKTIRVLATETRPLLQGARLTTWELKKAAVPFTLITDSMAGHFMRLGEVSCVIVGADRIAANGDTANKIGTYTLAVLAREHGLPFYVAAPASTIDSALASGDAIPIEERSPEEVTHIRGLRNTPEDCPAANPAFDVTPHRYITAIITERGIIREPYREGIKRALA
ncbi:MAG: S-methyl-5-thioribose-1-phosphate isomerase [Chloroflexi bacterium]|nr:S-methyl-5-thioribose-1-phosphate isomerase [Chloroflexota bacterium]